MYHALTFFYVFLYYSISIGLSFFSSYILNESEYNFRFPLFIAFFQNILHFLLSTIIITILQIKKEKKYSLVCSLSSAIDIGLSTYSLRIVSLAYYTMVKSSSPIFMLLCGFVFGIEKPCISTFLTIFTIGIGVFLTSLTKIFYFKGFIIILIASFTAGFRWSFVQYIIHKHQSHVLVTIQELSLPISFFLLMFCQYQEGLTNIISSEFFKRNSININITFLLISGVLSFLLILSEFLVVKRTSVLFLSISGIGKELIIILYSVVKKKIELTSVNYMGLVISVIGICMFCRLRKR
ncbi:Triose phosphate transporter [Spraguea lophii 42_110]|uniref:Triose phosphate transporter n=1 Tax=Spraguea lophii (strain 42_110) TaxID=1358809 RepID=S7W9D7_SPRLO|nr:Triose phosphate transporter [Spraguea lophii 42_110]